MTPAEQLALSDERDRWERFAYDMASLMYQAGYADGRSDQAREADQAWAAVPVRRFRAAPVLAEIEGARWTVHGEQRTRETFGQPHPADRRRQERAA